MTTCLNAHPGRRKRVRPLPCAAFPALSLILFLSVNPAIAAVKTWDGSHGGNWSTPASWAGGQVPVTGDDLVFPSGAAHLANTNDLIKLDLRSITFSGEGYNLMGNAVRITTSDGINGDHPSGTSSVQFNLGLLSGTTFSCAAAGATLRVDGAVDLNGDDLTFRVSSLTGEIQAGGIISGTGDVIKEGVGVLLLDGEESNAFEGTTRVNAGTLELNDVSVPLVDMVPGDVVVGDGALLLLTEGNQIADGARVTVIGDGLWDLNDHDEVVANLATENGGDVETGTGVLALGADGTVHMVAPYSTTIDTEISGFFDVGTGTCTWDVPGGNHFFRAQVRGAADIRVTGHAGSVGLMSSNSFTGTLTAENESLVVPHSNAFGTTNAGTYVEGNCYLVLHRDLHVVGESLTMNSSSPGALWVNGGSNTWSGPVHLDRDTTVNIIRSEHSLALDGAVTGTGGLTKLGPGTLRMAGPGDNAYTGDTVVEEGVLELATGRAVRYGTLVVGSGDGGAATDIVRFLNDWPIHVAVDVEIRSDGWMDFNGFKDDLGHLLFDRGRLTTGGTGALWMNSGLRAIESFSTNWVSIVDGNVNLMNPGTQVFDVDEGVLLNMAGPISGAGGIRKTGPGRLKLVFANTYEDLTVVEKGHLELMHPEGLGDTNAASIVHDGGSLQLSFDDTVTNETLELQGAGMPAYGALDTEYDTAWHGPVVLQADSTVYADAGNRLEIDGEISGPGGLETIGGGTLAFTGDFENRYAGTTSVSEGTLELGRAPFTPSVPGNLVIDGIVHLMTDLQTSRATDVTISDSGLLHCDGCWGVFDELAGHGEVRFSNPGGLEIGGYDGSSTFDGVLTGDGYVAEGLALVKVGMGTLTLNGTNTYTEGTDVRDGLLVVNGYQPQSSVLVQTAGGLSGTGTVGSLECHGSLAPGSSPGRLTCWDLELSADADYFVELTGPSLGDEYDQVRARGASELNDASVHVIPAFTSPVHLGQLFTIINSGSPTVGTFAGLPAEAEFEVGGFRFRLNYGDYARLQLVGVPAGRSETMVTTGNGNQVIDPNECNLLYLALTNTTDAPMTGVSAHLGSATHHVMVTQRKSLYPDVPVGGESFNLEPFQIATLPGFLCGEGILLDLMLDTSSHGIFKVPVVLYSGSEGGAPIRYDNASSLGIPDIGTVESVISVPGFTGRVDKVAVSLWITHTYVGDLILELVAPNGAPVLLSAVNDGGANFGSGCSPESMRTTFDDDAAAAIASGAAPFVGTYRPEEPLAGLLDTWGDGDWRLRITDEHGGSLGTLRCWSLFLSPMDCEPGGGYCDTCPGEFVGKIDASDPLQTGRLWNISSGPSDCLLPRYPLVGGTPDTEPRHHDVYTFTNDSPDEACISVGLLSTDYPVMSVAYLDEFVPDNVESNFAGFAGIATDPVSGAGLSYSFRAPPHTVFHVTVNEVSTNLQQSTYTLVVGGLPCPPPRLDIHRVSAETVRLDWPSWAWDYHLHSSSALNPPGWFWVFDSPTVSGGRYNVTNAAPPTGGFFRLERASP